MERWWCVLLRTVAKLPGASANYSALEAQKIIGQPSDAIVKALGYMAEPELVHRDNLILV